jgi:anion transporter
VSQVADGISKTKIFGTVLAFAALFTIWFGTFEGLSVEARHALAITAFGGIMWVFMVMPFAMTGLLMLLMYVAFRVVPYGVAFSGFSQASIWMILYSFLLAKAVEKSGLGNRIGLIILTRFAKLTYSKLIITFMVLMFIGNLFVPSYAAYVVVLIGLAQGVLKALGQPTDQRTQLSAGLVCFFGMLGLINGKNFISGVIGNSVITGMLLESTGINITWTQWALAFIWMIPFPLITTYFYCMKVYKPEIEFNRPGMREELKANLKALGPLSPSERNVAILFLIVLFLWITRLGGLSVQMATGIVSFALLLPKIGALTYDDLCKINYPMFIFIGSAVSMGTVLSQLGIDEWIASYLTALPIIQQGSYFTIATILFLLIVVAHVIMESLAQAALFMPVLMKMGVLPPHQLAGIVSAGIHVYQFPFQSSPIAISLGFGLVDGRDLVQYGLFLSVVQIIQVIVGFFFGWPYFPGL